MPFVAPGLEIRRAQQEDRFAIKDLAADVNDRASKDSTDFSDVSNVPAKADAIGALIELSYLSLVAVNTDKGAIIGFASFDDHAVLESKSLAGSQYFHNWFRTFNAKTSGCNAHNTLWLTYFCAADKNETEVVNQMVRTTYLTLPEISNVAFRLPRKTRDGAMTPKLKFLMSSTFDRMIHERDVGSAGELITKTKEIDEALYRDLQCSVFVNQQQRFFPKLTIRPARVEDYDDLQNVFDAQKSDTKEQYGEFFLAELIKNQDANNKALVAEVDSKAVGMMALTTDVNIEVLAQCFELEPFGNLLVTKELQQEESADEVEVEQDDSRAVGAGQGQNKPKKCIIIAGAPASGKGSQCELIKQMYSSIHLSTGDMLRAEVAAESEVGLQAKELMEAGKLVDDELITAIVLRRLDQEDCKENGWLLDGFPRTKAQADALAEAGYIPDSFLLLDVPDEVLEKRVVGRRLDPETGKIYHVEFNPAESEEVESRLVQRADDTAEKLKERLANYKAQIDAVSGSFQEVLVNIDGNQSKGEVSAAIEAALGGSNAEADSAEAGVDGETAIEGEKAEETGKNEGEEGEDGAESGAADEFAMDDMLGDMAMIVDEVEEDGDALAGGEEGESLGEEDEDLTSANVFAITVFCVDEAFETRIKDFLPAAFEVFPEREYCLVSTAPEQPSSPLLSSFTMARARPQSTFSHLIHLLHRDALLYASTLSVRRASPDDHVALEALCEPLENRSDIMSAFLAANAELETGSSNPVNATYLLVAGSKEDETLLGVAAVTRSNLDKDGVERMKSSYDVENYVQFRYHDESGHAFLTDYAINPNFSRSTKFVLLEVLRQSGLSCLYYRTFPSSEFAPIHYEMIQLRPRQKPEPRAASFGAESYGDLDERAGHCLHFITRHLLSEPKISNNSRIVVVGASDCALSFVESLLLVPYLHFTNITVLAPGGHPQRSRSYKPSSRMRCMCDADGSARFKSLSSSYTAEDVEKLAFSSRVKILTGAGVRMVDLDRESKAILLADDSIMPYDYLIVAAGRQEASARKFGYGVNGTDEQIPSGLFFLTDYGAERMLAEHVDSTFWGSDSTCVIFGASLDAFVAVQTLLAMQVDPSRITMVQPLARGSGGGTVQCPFPKGPEGYVAGKIEQSLKYVGVKIIQGMDLVKIDVRNHRVTGVKVASTTLSSVGGEEGKGKDEGEALSLKCSLVICASRKDVDHDVFSAVNESGLVFDARLVVDNKFRTTDNAIFAAGTLTKFSRRYGAKRALHDFFNSKEVGMALANCFLEKVDPLQAGVADENAIPRFSLPKKEFAYLPGDLQYLHVSSCATDAFGAPVGTEGCRELWTDPEAEDGQWGGRYCRLVLDRYGYLQSITYLGSSPVEQRNFSKLVGLHESYINDLVHFYDNGLIKDLVEFFHGNWAVALYHDRFRELCQSLRLDTNEDLATHAEKIRMMAETGLSDEKLNQQRREMIGVGGAKLKPSTRESSQLALIEWMKENRLDLDMYFLPEARRKGSPRSTKK